MRLDAPSLEIIVTPEIALNLVKRTVNAKGWKKITFSDINLIFTPFWMFSFDVAGSKNSGRLAINAFTGEIDDYVPFLFQKFKKIRETPKEMKPEIEETSIEKSELKDILPKKLSAIMGTKPEEIVVSAFSKFYVPFYKIWVSTPRGDYEIRVDGCSGNPLGAEKIPEKEKTWSEAAIGMARKMQSPSGIVELARGLGRKTKSRSLSSGPIGWVLGNTKGRWLLILVVIIVLLFVALKPAGPALTCKQSEAPYFHNDMMSLNGTCEFKNPTNKPMSGRARVFLIQDGVERKDVSQIVIAPVIEPNSEAYAGFMLNWTPDYEHHEYALGFEIQ